MKNIHIVVSDEDWKLIEKQLNQSGKNLKTFITDIATNGIIYKADYEAMREHTKALAEYKKTILETLYTIQQTEEAYNSDIQNILMITNKVLETEKKLLQQENREYEKIQKKVKEIARNEMSKRFVEEGEVNDM